MKHHITRQYQAPKWQARILQDDKCYFFPSGLKVCSLWELKQALKSISQADLESAVGEGYNYIADWVEHVIGDRHLADQLRRTTHRWGLIVNLERQMMRTLHLPNYVAQRWLSPAVSPFTLADGRQVWSLYELRDALQHTASEVIEKHLQPEPNDFVVWIDNAIGDYLLSGLLKNVKSHKQLINRISDHLVMLEDAADNEN